MASNHQQSTKRTFNDLGIDIISEIILFLSIEEVQSLKLTSKSLYNLVENSSYIWHELYKSTFGTKPTPYSTNKWPELYILRSRAKVYTWGDLSGGRLGYFRDSSINNTFATIGRIRSQGQNTPRQIPGLEGVILADVTAGGFSFQILTDKGEIYSSATYHSGHRSGPGPSRPDFNELQHLARDQERDLRENAPLPITPGTIRVGTLPARPYVIPVPRIEDEDPEDVKIVNRLIRKAHAKGHPGLKFISVSSGRTHFVGLDSSGGVWSWDGGDYGININFIDENGYDLVKDKHHKVMRVVAGWDYNVGYLYGYGLVFWRSRTNLEEYGQFEANAIFTRVPGTSNLNGDGKVIDFVGLDGYLVYVTKDGRLWRNDLIGEASIEMTSFSEYLKEHTGSVSPRFERLSGNFQKFAVFGTDGQVLIGTKESHTPIIVPEIQNKECISVAVGDYHFLALLKSGELLSWGLESRFCGCLGLGSDISNSNVENGSIRVRTPTRVDVGDKKVLAIAASGWQSSAIISD